MKLLPFFSQELCMLLDESLRTLHVAIGDRPHDLDRLMRRQIDLHDGTSFRDMHMRGGWSKV